MSALTRGLRIVLDVDPDLIPGGASRVDWCRPLRLLPCAGGVVMYGKVYATPEALSSRLSESALAHAVHAGELSPHTATWRYREDRSRFCSIAATLVLTDPRCLRLWGLA